MCTEHEDEHEAFAASRSRDFIYERGIEGGFDSLDGHAEILEGNSKLPLVITGSQGCGKSALLANWVSRRRHLKHRDEFLFQHFVGSSARSKQLTHLLYRLESALKDHFQLREMEVPTSEERLRWSLYRFLAAAAKKQFPARIIIVLDAVNRLQGESSAADTMHWLPTELPRGVRMILATTEMEANCGRRSEHDPAHDDGTRVDRTYTELRRRKCPMMCLQPLTVELRHKIIDSFKRANQHSFDLDQAQQFRLVTAKASSQPLYLRTVLCALRLGSEMTQAPMDQQIDACLSEETASALIAHLMGMCSQCVCLSLMHVPPFLWPAVSNFSEADLHLDAFGSMNGTSMGVDIFAEVMRSLYTSRTGLSESELWGLLESRTGTPLPLCQQTCVKRVLHDFTFAVQKYVNFSHEDYAAAVYLKYIRSPEIQVRAHQLLAKFFGKLPPCHRKLEALPYHLEVSGSWSRLRTALVDVRMFSLWWTSSHNHEFLRLWASLTAVPTASPTQKLVTGDLDDVTRLVHPLRPRLDIVDEYVTSVNDYIFTQSPADGELSGVILQIADFMLEFATSSLEEAADVPRFLRQSLPDEDLASLGVPYISRDKDGNSVLNTPLANCVRRKPSKDTNLAQRSCLDALPEVDKDVPVCSTYFYHRWMWIQFPLICIANCGQRNLEYLTQRARENGNSVEEKANSSSCHALLRSNTHCQTVAEEIGQACTVNDAQVSGATTIHGNNTWLYGSSTTTHTSCHHRDFLCGRHYSASCVEYTAAFCSSSDVKFPSIGTHAGEVAVIQGRIVSYLLKMNQLRRDRLVLTGRFQRKCSASRELSGMHNSTQLLKAKLGMLSKQLEDIQRGCRIGQLLFQNLKCVHLMCRRHPAHNQALLDELESKLRQDGSFISRVQQSLIQARSELRHVHKLIRIFQQVSQERTLLKNCILIKRIRQHDKLKLSLTVNPNLEPVEVFADGALPRSLGRHEICDGHAHNCCSEKAVSCNQDVVQRSLVVDACNWEKFSEVIRKRTFISDAKEFFEKVYNALTLQSQLIALHHTAEVRQRELKSCLSGVEADLEHVRYGSQSFVGSNSREARDLQARLAVQLARHKHAREASFAAERLRQGSFGGLRHVCGTLGIAPPDQDTPVSEIIHQVEGVLESLLDERDKLAQRLGDAQQNVVNDKTTGFENMNRAPELDAALEQFQMTKALIAYRLPSKAADESRTFQRDVDVEVNVDDGETLLLVL